MIFASRIFLHPPSKFIKMSHTLYRSVKHIANDNFDIHKRMNTYTFGIHNRTVLSLEADATRWPEGENRTDMTWSLCPTKR